MVADNLEGVSLNCIEDIFEGYLFRGPEKLISPFGTTDALNHIPFSQTLQDLLGVWEIYSLSLSDFSRPDRWLSESFGEVQGAKDPALSPFSYSHISTLLSACRR